MLRSPLQASRRSLTATSTVSSWRRAPDSHLPIDIAPEVQQALHEGTPIVALESTLITHGLPPPYSLDLPLACEALLRAQGVTPATIGIIGGRIKVGLAPGELARLSERGFEARTDGGETLWKVGRRELGAAVVKRVDGGTTVSGTMAVAHLAGIKVFSTGGIGGVHRGAETSFDISSDLIALSDTPVAVVCAGSKSILDIGLTLEYLEAHAVPVASYGTPDWPAFYTPTSGFKAPMQLDGAFQVAETIYTTDLLGLPSSLLLGVPIPAAFHAAGIKLQAAVEQAVLESIENGMSKSGKRVTPWLLGRVAELTKGDSIASNVALIKNNVKVGGEIAWELARILRERTKTIPSSFMPDITSTASPPALPVSQPPPIAPTEPIVPVSSPLVIVGSLAIDLTLIPSSSSPLLTTTPGTVSLSLGGVASNIASASHSLGVSDVLLVSPVAGLEDLLSVVARRGLEERGMRSDGLVVIEGEKTATCGILMDAEGELIGGVADMGIVELMDPKQIVEQIKKSETRLVAFDGNLAPSAMSAILAHCEEAAVDTFFEPTSNIKSLRLLAALESPAFESGPLPTLFPLVSFATPNIHELSALYAHVNASEAPIFAPTGAWFDSINVSGDLLRTRLPAWVSQEGIAQMAVNLLPVIGCVFVKSGARGVLVVQRVSGADAVNGWKNEAGKKGTLVAFSTARADEAVVLRYYPAIALSENAGAGGTVTGAGDNLAGALLASLVKGKSTSVPRELDAMVQVGMRAAVCALGSREAVGDLESLSQEI